MALLCGTNYTCMHIHEHTHTPGTRLLLALQASCRQQRSRQLVPARPKQCTLGYLCKERVTSLQFRSEIPCSTTLLCLHVQGTSLLQSVIDSTITYEHLHGLPPHTMCPDERVSFTPSSYTHTTSEKHRSSRGQPHDVMKCKYNIRPTYTQKGAQ